MSKPLIEQIIEPVTLWEGNINGISQEITLSEDSNSFKRIIVIGTVSNQTRHSEFYVKEQTEGDLNIAYANNTYQYHYGCIYSISKDKFNLINGWALVIGSGGNIAGHFEGDNQISITKIIGYK